MADMQVIRLADTEVVKFGPDATYQLILGDDEGTTPIRTGIQTSQPGYATPPHSHPYAEILTVIEGRGEAWLDGEEGVVLMEPGVTIAVPANRVHAFRVVGDGPLVTFGIHAHGKRIVNYVSSRPSPG
jgi:quercetin dioxygenase-like cupin family protein